MILLHQNLDPIMDLEELLIKKELLTKIIVPTRKMDLS